MLSSGLTQKEKEVLDMLTIELITPKQITIRRKTSREATNKIIRNLKKKGAYNIGCQKVVVSGGGSTTPQPNQIRLHNQQFSIRILHVGNTYQKKQNTQLTIDNNSVALWPKTIDIYSNQEFYGNDISQAFGKAFEYWDRFIARLEHETDCVLKKPRSQNIHLVRLHIAETNNEVAKEVDNKGDRYFQVFSKEDGKLWFLIDNSFNLHEAEAVHSKTAREDMEKVRDVFNDVRDKDSYLPSDTKAMIDKLAIVSSNMLQYTEKANQNVEWLAENIKQHGPAWFGMAKEAGNIRKEVKRLTALLSQRKLTEF